MPRIGIVGEGEEDEGEQKFHGVSDERAATVVWVDKQNSEDIYTRNEYTKSLGVLLDIGVEGLPGGH